MLWLTAPGQIIIMIAPPPNVAYPFILNVQGYPIQAINLFVVIVGLIL